MSDNGRWHDSDNERQAQCGGKEVFDSPEAAARGVKRIKRGYRGKRSTEGNIHGYRCDFCRKWHIGRTHAKPKRFKR